MAGISLIKVCLVLVFVRVTLETLPDKEKISNNINDNKNNNNNNYNVG